MMIAIQAAYCDAFGLFDIDISITMNYIVFDVDKDDFTDGQCGVIDFDLLLVS